MLEILLSNQPLRSFVGPGRRQGPKVPREADQEVGEGGVSERLLLCVCVFVRVSFLKYLL